MKIENEILRKLLENAKKEIFGCFAKHIDHIQQYEDEKSKTETLAAAKTTPSSMATGLKNIVAAGDGKTTSQQATFQLQEIANSVDRGLEEWINKLTSV